MKFTKRLTAALLAVSSMTAVTASLNSAFAYEGLSLEEEHFIASFDSEEERRLAISGVKDNLPFETIESAINDYRAFRMAEQVSLLSDGSATVYKPYYTLNAVTDVTRKHYILTMTTGRATTIDVAYDFVMDNNYVDYAERRFALYASPMSLSVGDITSITYTPPGSYRYRCLAYGTANSNNIPELYSPIAVYELDVHGAMRSENDIFSAITMQKQYYNTDFTYETFMKLDNDHDGDVDLTDYNRVLAYIAEVDSTFELTYLDGSTHHSRITNFVAADKDGNGIISLSDAVGMLPSTSI